MSTESEEALWIFGYGSLVWRPDFPHRTRRAAWIRGWSRRFWQGSTDHRGVPGAPGRVVTLLRESTATCWGAAYQVEPSAVPEVLHGLDHREKGGYARHDVELHFAGTGGEPLAGGLMYVATPQNPNYLGHAPLETIALQVRRSHGPSGSNLEYVARLAASLRELGAEDGHVFALAALLGIEGESAA